MDGSTYPAQPFVPGILIIVHAPLASALCACAGHVYCAAPQGLEGLDVAADASPQAVLRDARQAVARLARDDGEVLVLTDAIGATPCNTARSLLSETASTPRVRLVGGVNLPMLLRCLCYRDEGLDRLVPRAVEGGQRAVAEIEASSPQPCCPPDPCAAAAPPCPCSDARS